jgi:hypothetical protein
LILNRARKGRPPRRLTPEEEAALKKVKIR